MERNRSIAKSGKVIFDPELCRGCRICELACSLYHEGQCSPGLSRIQIHTEDLSFIFHGETCAQCDSPACYLACPLEEKALCIDSKTGARYVNADECTGCGSCVEACPYETPRTRINRETNAAFKCDLCREREEGPICVEMCPRGALTFELRS